MRALIIKDDIHLIKPLTDRLKEHGYQCDAVETLKDGDYYLDVRHYDLLLMGSILPDGDGLDFIPEVKPHIPKTIIIILSDKDNSHDEVKALRSGADDYIKAPFDLDVLIARIKIRSFVDNIIEIDDLKINSEEEKLTFKEQEIDLKGKPFEVFAYIARHRKTIVSKEQILDALWIDPELVFWST